MDEDAENRAEGEEGEEVEEVEAGDEVCCVSSLCFCKGEDSLSYGWDV